MGSSNWNCINDSSWVDGTRVEVASCCLGEVQQLWAVTAFVPCSLNCVHKERAKDSSASSVNLHLDGAEAEQIGIRPKFKTPLAFSNWFSLILFLPWQAWWCKSPTQSQLATSDSLSKDCSLSDKTNQTVLLVPGASLSVTGHSYEKRFLVVP